MKHLKSFRTLNRTKSHRTALYRNMIEALIKKERIKTTTVKAKELRKVVEKMITRAKVKSLHNIRLVNKLIKDDAVIMKLFDEIGPRYVERAGGYTRIIKIARRLGDGAEVSYIELVEEAKVSKKGKKKAKGDAKPKAEKEAKPKTLAKKAEEVEEKVEEKAEA